jgi:hypothetical protein
LHLVHVMIDHKSLIMWLHTNVIHTFQSDTDEVFDVDAWLPVHHV